MKPYTVLVPTRDRTWVIYEVREGVSTRRGVFPSETEARTHATSENLPNIRDLFECIVCGQQQFDNFMVHNMLWRRAGLGRGSIHFRCLESLLGRPLAQSDFIDAPINAAIKFGYQMGFRDAQQPMFNGSLLCRTCGHRWSAKIDLRLDLHFLSCPSCQEQTGELGGAALIGEQSEPDPP